MGTRSIIDIVILILIYILFFYKKWKKNNKATFVFKTLMYIYICLVLLVTILPLPLKLDFNRDETFEYGNIIPFHDLILNRGNAMEEIILNIIMFFPFGFLLTILKKNMKAYKVIIYSFLFSSFIEISQLLMTILANSRRSFDVTDIITNTIGGYIGFILFLVLEEKIKKYIKLKR